MKFIIVHGSYGSPDGNWFPELKEKLEHLDQEVLVPQFPVDTWENVTKQGKDYRSTVQSLGSWLQTFEDIYKKLDPNEKICFVGHSLGPLFILHLVEKFKLNVDSAIFVSPFLTSLNKWEFDVVNNSFYKSNFDFNKLQKQIPVSYVLYSDNDPYVPTQLSLDFAKNLNSAIIQVKKAGHINSEVNLNEFPLVFELCKTRLDLSLYQKYMAHRKDLYSVDYVKGKSEEVIYLNPEEVIDEGVFKFRNLRYSGFCTYYLPLTSFWDPNSRYMQEARNAARRTKKFERVFIVNDVKSLENPVLKTQIELDLQNHVVVYLISQADVEKIGSALDFGIWDNEYVCYVQTDEKPLKEIKLSSLHTDLAQANEWKAAILKKAKRVLHINNLRDFNSQ